MNKAYNFPCTCGHAKVNHSKWPQSNIPNELVCNVGGCDCFNFIADNLKYLENKYDKEVNKNG